MTIFPWVQMKVLHSNNLCRCLIYLFLAAAEPHCMCASAVWHWFLASWGRLHCQVPEGHQSVPFQPHLGQSQKHLHRCRCWVAMVQVRLPLLHMAVCCVWGVCAWSVMLRWKMLFGRDQMFCQTILVTSRRSDLPKVGPDCNQVHLTESLWLQSVAALCTDSGIW